MPREGFEYEVNPSLDHDVPLVGFLSLHNACPDFGIRAESEAVKKDANTLNQVPDPKVKEIRLINREDWPNPIVIVNADSFYLILPVESRGAREELNLADLEKTLKELKLDRWPLGRVVAVQETV